MTTPSTRPTDDLAVLLEPARRLLADDETLARSVRLARARTLSGAAPRHERLVLGRFAPLGKLALAAALAAFVLVATLFARSGGSWLRDRSAAPAAIAFSVGATPGVVGERIVAASRRVLDFDDGTRVELEARGALRVIALDERGGRILVEQGKISAAFRHRERTYWTVEAGGLVVEVTGTRFDVSFDQTTQAFELVMHEGSVKVRGCGIEEGRVVKDVESIRVSCAVQPGAAETPPPTPRVLTPADLPSVTPIAIPAPSSLPSLAPAARADSSLELLARADAARRSGDVTTARTTLLELRRRFPGGAAAPQAAFDLGVLAFDADGDYAGAARWFRRYLEEAPRGPLAREALGRVIEAQSSSGDTEGATATATRYLDMYPGGPHASLAKRLVAKRP